MTEPASSTSQPATPARSGKAWRGWAALGVLVMGLSVTSAYWYFTLLEAPPPAPVVVVEPPPPLPEPPAPPQTGEILAQVLDGRGRPVAKATVTCDGIAAAPLPDGGFRCPGLKIGAHAIAAQAPGFASTPAAGVTAAIPAGGGPLRISLVLMRPAQIGGLVQARGSSVGGARITLHWLAGLGPTGPIPPGASTDAGTTQPSGRFVVSQVWPGKLRVEARLADGAVAQSEIFIVEEGQTRDGIAIDFPSGGDLVATVRSPEGQPVPCQARLQGGILVDSFGALCDASGALTLKGVPAGQWQILVESRGYEAIRAQVAIAAHRETSAFYTLSRIGGIAGRVVDSHDVPVGGASVGVRPDSGPVDTVASAEDGSFSWQPPPDWSGRAVLQALHPAHGPSAQVTAVKGTEVVMHMGAGGLIEGRVEDQSGRAVAGASVVASGGRFGSEPVGTDSATTVVAGADGSFRLGPLRPGAYDLRARADNLPQGLLENMVVSADATHGGVIIRLDAEAWLSGLVTGGDGLPAAGAAVTVLEPGSGATLGATATDAEGRYRVAALPPSRATVTVVHDSWAPHSRTGVVLLAQQDTRLDLKLRAPSQATRATSPVLGAGFVQTGNGMRMVKARSGSLAAESGMRSGDVVLSIEGQAVAAVGMKAAMALLERPNVSMQVMIERDGKQMPVYIHGAQKTP